ncbi:MAG: hypothetical protein K2X99_00685 [Gemmatimonadaceae bacterium]|nr:hypothetical protein [Gemmatimonadaceae bacterium]
MSRSGQGWRIKTPRADVLFDGQRLIDISGRAVNLDKRSADAVRMMIEMREEGRRIDNELLGCAKVRAANRGRDRQLGWLQNPALATLPNSRLPESFDFETRSSSRRLTVKLSLPSAADLLAADGQGESLAAQSTDETCYSKCCDLGRQLYQVNYFINNPIDYALAHLAESGQALATEALGALLGYSQFTLALGATALETVFSFAGLSIQRAHIAGEMRENNCL